jgi:TolB-like protein/DNA-binding winged helix-turn-helix (wHTH) protein
MPEQTIQFGEFELAPASYELRRLQKPVKIEKIPMELLIFLATQQGRLVTRKEIIEQIWGADVFLDTEHAINTAIRKIRLTLGDDADQPRFVQTVVGKGYRFAAVIQETASNGETKREAVELKSTAGRETAASVSAVSAPTEEVSTFPLAAPRRRGRVGLWLAIVTVGVSAALLWIFLRPFSTKDTAPIRSIAVLPLDNLSGDPGQDYLADGLTDELITHLANLGSLKVISRTSVMRYKGTHKPLSEIARELNVDGIVEGSVVRSGNDVRVTVQLIRVANDRHLWAEDYQRELGDLIGLQRQIARTIAHEVAVHLDTEQKAYFEREAPHDPQLNEAYLRGLFFWEKRTDADLRRAIDNFKLAISRDSGFAPAYAGVANSYNLLWYLGFMKADEAVPQARTAVEKALILDPLSPEAHVGLAYLKHHYDWDWAGAELEHRRAIELRPGYSLAHQWYGYYLLSVGRVDEALAERELARELDPLSVFKTIRVADVYVQKRDDAHATFWLQRAMELNPSDPAPHYALSRLMETEGRAAEAALQWRDGLQLQGDAKNLAMFDKTIAQSGFPAGRRAIVEKLLGETTAKAKTSYVSPRNFVELYLQMGDRENALRCLDEAFTEHSSFLVQIGGDPTYNSLRGEARFRAMLRRMGVPGAR